MKYEYNIFFKYTKTTQKAKKPIFENVFVTDTRNPKHFKLRINLQRPFFNFFNEK
jgi:hypothetical protein